MLTCAPAGPQGPTPGRRAIRGMQGDRLHEEMDCTLGSLCSVSSTLGSQGQPPGHPLCQ